MRGIQMAVLTVVVLLLVLPMGAAAETGGMEIPVSVLVEGSEPDWNAVYTLELVAQGEDCPMPEGSRDGVYRIAVKGGSTGVIRLVGGKPGEYGYLLRQIPGTDPDCTYDDRQFRLWVVDSGEAVSVMAYDPKGQAVTDILFQNRWAEAAWVTLSAMTTLDSATPEDGLFRLLLLSEDGERVAEAGNQGRQVRFPALRFAEEGVYRYEMKETAETGRGIVYDRAVYTVLVTVCRDGDYRAEVSCSRNGSAYGGIPCFLNFTEGSVPQTGDPITVWITVMVLSWSMLMGLFWKKKRPPKGGR